MPKIPENRLKGLRTSHGHTQEALAIAAGLDARTIQRAENGENVSNETCTCIAAVYNIEVQELLSVPKKTTLSPPANEVAVTLTKIESEKVTLRELGVERRELEQFLEKEYSIEKFLMILKELQAYGLLKFNADSGGIFIRPTAKLFLFFAEHIDYDPKKDAEIVAKAVLGENMPIGRQIEAKTHLPPLRINWAVDILEANDYVKIHRFMDPHYTFGRVEATWKLHAAFPETE